MAENICGLLERCGITCWIAPRDVIPVGPPFAEQIIDAIESTHATILVLSEHANDSDYVRNEISLALQRGKTIIPVRIRNVQPLGALQLYIADRQWVEAWIPPLEQRMDQLAVAIIRVLPNK